MQFELVFHHSIWVVELTYGSKEDDKESYYFDTEEEAQAFATKIMQDSCYYDSYRVFKSR